MWRGRGKVRLKKTPLSPTKFVAPILPLSRTHYPSLSFTLLYLRNRPLFCWHFTEDSGEEGFTHEFVRKDVFSKVVTGLCSRCADICILVIPILLEIRFTEEHMFLTEMEHSKPANPEEDWKLENSNLRAFLYSILSNSTKIYMVLKLCKD